MDFRNRFAHQEKSTEKENEVPSGKAIAGDGKEVFFKSDDDADAQKQNNPYDQGQHQTDLSGFVLKTARKLSGDDGDKNDVVNAQHNLQ